MIFAIAAVVIFILLYLLFFLENRRFVVSKESIEQKNIPSAFTIVQVSDLHDREFGTNQETLLKAIRNANPDCIVITGDLFNRRNKNAYSHAYEFVKGAVRIAPVVFAEGNHECSLKEIGEHYIREIEKFGVHVLRDAYIDYPHFRLIGLKQFASPEVLSSMLDSDRFNLVLAHRPELFPVYAGTDADFVLSGHAHGGQVRMFRHGLYAPGQGLFPKYTEGFHRRGNSTLYVSRGLGNTIPFPRVFNTPELNVLNFIPIRKEEDHNVC